jgi:hypothetical protein
MRLGDFVMTIVLPMLGITAIGELYCNFVLFAGPMRNLNDTFLLTIGLTFPAIIGAMMLVIFLLATVFEIQVTASGVKFRYLLSRPFTVEWGQLVPPEYPYKGTFRLRGIAFDSLPTAPGVKAMGKGVSDRPGENMPLWVSLEQARAILLHPNCPNWQLSADIWKSLGIETPPAGRVTPEGKKVSSAN